MAMSPISRFLPYTIPQDFVCFTSKEDPRLILDQKPACRTLGSLPPIHHERPLLIKVDTQTRSAAAVFLLGDFPVVAFICTSTTLLHRSTMVLMASP